MQYSPPLFAKCTLPVDDDLLRAVVRSSDSVSGLDGLPYAANRAAPNAASRALTHRLHDYVGHHAPAPVQALVFIPKADAGRTQTAFGRWGSLIPLIASLIKLCMCKCTQPSRFPSS